MSRLEIEAFSPKVRAMEMALHWCCAGPHTPRGGTRRAPNKQKGHRVAAMPSSSLASQSLPYNGKLSSPIVASGRARASPSRTVSRVDVDNSNLQVVLLR